MSQKKRLKNFAKNSRMKKIKKFVKKIPEEVKYIFLLFISTRFALILIGILSPLIFRAKIKNLFLDMWAKWDTVYYVRIASAWYSQQVGGRYGFFPLYPLTVRIVGKLIHNYYIAGLIVSNVCLILAALFLYKLVKLDYDKETSLKSIKYLFLFPTAFLFSCILSESLFLFLLIACFYYAKKENWLVSGIFGFFTALTRPVGAFIVFPLFYLYLKTKDFKIRNIRPSILFLLLIPLGAFLFGCYSYYLTGDFFAYVHIKEKWRHTLTNPITLLYTSIFSNNPAIVFNAVFAIGVFILIFLTCRKVGFTYSSLAFILMIVPLFSGSSALTGLARYALVAFPLFISLALLFKNRKNDEMLTIFLVLLQGALSAIYNSSRLLIR